MEEIYFDKIDCENKHTMGGGRGPHPVLHG